MWLRWRNWQWRAGGAKIDLIGGNEAKAYTPGEMNGTLCKRKVSKMAMLTAEMAVAYQSGKQCMAPREIAMMKPGREGIAREGAKLA